MYRIFSIQSSLDGRLGCSHVLATVNSAAAAVGVHVFCFFLDLGLLPKAADFELPVWIALYTTRVSLSLPILLRLQVLCPQNSLLWWSQFTLIMLFLTLAFSGCIAKLAPCHVFLSVCVCLSVLLSLGLCSSIPRNSISICGEKRPRPSYVSPPHHISDIFLGAQ